MKLLPCLSFLLLSTLFSSLISQGTGEKILFLFPFASKSHTNVFQPLINGLAERGHEMTVLSPVKPKKSLPNIKTHTFFSIEDFMGHMQNPFDLRRQGPMAIMTSMDIDNMIEQCRKIYRHPDFQEILKQQFDLIIMSGFMNNCLDGAIYKLKAPHALIATVAAPSVISEFTGNYLPTSFVPSFLLANTDRMNFFERVLNMAMDIFMRGVTFLWMNPKFEAMYKEELGIDGPGMEIHKNVSLLLMNSHFSLTFPRPNLPDNIEVGGMHCRPSKPLPKDLDEFLSGAEHGFIYFSLGSIVQGSIMPEETRKAFLKVFGKLKQRVIWKWETEEMDDLPSNVKLSKWLPQQDILGHRNIRLFMTHGGLLSTQEAVYHGVPLLGFPIFGDQDLNMKQAEVQGYAIKVEILDLTEEVLEEKLLKILNIPSYTQRAKDLSSIFRDQTETPVERAVFWTEYVMRHKGAPHLRSGARDLNYFQVHSYDVIGFLLSITLITLWILKLIVCKVIRGVICCFSAKNCGKTKKSGSKTKSSKKKN